MNTVFFASPGRSGTLYLAMYLGQALPSRWVARHEPHRDLGGDYSSEIQYKRLEVLKRTRRTLELCGTQGYVETGLQFVRYFMPQALEVFPNLRVVHVVRDCLSTALSWHGALSPVTLPFVQVPWMTDEIRCNVTSRYMHLLWECYECHARALKLKGQLGPDRYYFFPFSRISNDAEMADLARWIHPEADPSRVRPHEHWLNKHNSGPVFVTKVYMEEYYKWYESLAESEKIKVDEINGLFRTVV